MHLVTSNPELAPRNEITFTCTSGHQFQKTFSADVAAPTAWDCPRCGRAGSQGHQPFPSAETNSRKTHWDMIIERRDLDELSWLLIERVDELRAA